MKLYDKSECPFCWKVRIAIAEASVTTEIFDSQSFDNINDWQALTPRKTVPVLTVDSTIIYESNVILEYLHDSTKKLLGTRIDERIQARLMNQYSDIVIGAGIREVIFEKRNKAKQEWDLQRIKMGIEMFEQALEYLSEQLANKDFFADSYSFAECALTARFGLAQAYGVEIPTRFPNLIDWFERMKLRSSYKRTAPKICLI